MAEPVLAADAVSVTGLTRRELLRRGAAVGFALGGLDRLLGPAAQVASASAVAQGQQIDFFFVVMMENRSFDHLFGYSPISGTDVLTGQPREIDNLLGKSFSNNDMQGRVYNATPRAGFRIEIPKSGNSARSSGGDPDHEFFWVMMCLCGTERTKAYMGKTRYDTFLKSSQGVPIPLLPFKHAMAYPHVDNSGFVRAYQLENPNTSPSDFDIPMRGLEPFDLPILNTLAREYLICDSWFSSVPGPTWTNRFWVHGASPTLERFSDDPDQGRIIDAAKDIFKGRIKYRNGTIFSHLQSVRPTVQSLITYDSQSSFCAQADALSPRSNAQKPFEWFVQKLGQPGYPYGYTFIEPDPGNQGWSILGLNPCHEQHPTPNDMHPPGDIRKGEEFIRSIYEAVSNSRYWNRSALLIVFDEAGSFFDHVPPPAAPPPGDGPFSSTSGFNFDQYGLRVPAIIVSPWVGRGTIDNRRHDHSSVARTLEKRFGAKPLTNRDRSANDFLDVFTQSTPRTDRIDFGPIDVHRVDPGAPLATTKIGHWTGTETADLLYENDGFWWHGAFEPSPDGVRTHRISWRRQAATPSQLGSVRIKPSWVGRFAGGNTDTMIVWNILTQVWWQAAPQPGGAIEFSQLGRSNFGPQGQLQFWQGDFNGDGRDEILVYQLDQHTWWLSQFGQAQPFAVVGKESAFNPAGDPNWPGMFTRDPQAVILYYATAKQSWGMASLAGGQIAFNPVIPFQAGEPKLQSPVGVKAWTLRDHLGAGLSPAQLLLYEPGSGNWFLAGSVAGPDAVVQPDERRPAHRGVVGDIFFLTFSGHAPINASWPVQQGDFDDDGRDDLLFYRTRLNSPVSFTYDWLHVSAKPPGVQVVGASTGDATGFGDTSKLPTWAVRFSGNADQLLFQRPSDGEWWLGTLAGNGQLGWAAARNKALDQKV